jgi:LysM repeat protein
MKLRRATLLGAVSVASLLGAAEPAIEFSGVLSANGKTRIALTDTATKTTTWVGPGSQFSGYTVERYDPKEEVVFLKKSGQELRLPMVSGKTRDGSATTAGSEPTTDTITTAVRANLRLLASAARQYQMAHGTTSATYSDLVGPDKLIKELKPIAGENYSTLSFGPNVTGVNVTTANGAVVSLDLPPTSAAPASVGGAPASAVAIQSPPPPPTAPAPTAGAPATPAITASAPTLAPEGLQPTGRPTPSSYTTQGGDTWQKISQSTGVPIPQLKQLNPAIPEGNSLPAGQAIRTR